MRTGNYASSLGSRQAERITHPASWTSSISDIAMKGWWQVRLYHEASPRFAATIVRFSALLVVVLLFASAALGAPPDDTALDPELHKWFESLRQPLTAMLCCALSDCRFVPFEITNGHYEVDIEGWHYVVRDGVVVPGIANPTGKAVACYTISTFGPPDHPADEPQDTIEILCFVPPRPPS
jgi:hypothetical protein